MEFCCSTKLQSNIMRNTTEVNIRFQRNILFPIIFPHRLEVWPPSENREFTSRSKFFKLRINEDKFRRRFNQQTWNTKQPYETSSWTAYISWGKAHKFAIEKRVGGWEIAWKFPFCKYWYSYFALLMMYFNSDQWYKASGWNNLWKKFNKTPNIW